MTAARPQLAHAARLHANKMARATRTAGGNYDQAEHQFGTVVGQQIIGIGWSTGNTVDVFLDGAQHAGGANLFDPSYKTVMIPYLSSYVPTGAAAPGRMPGPGAPFAAALFPDTSLSSPALTGATSVSTLASIAAGTPVTIGSSMTTERNTVTAVTGTGPYMLTLANPLTYNHGPGEFVEAIPGTVGWRYAVSGSGGGQTSQLSPLSDPVLNGDPAASNVIDSSYANDVSWGTIPRGEFYSLFRTTDGVNFTLLNDSIVVVGVPTTLTAPASAGATSVSVLHTLEAVVGQYVEIAGTDENTAEDVAIAAIAGSGPYTLSLATPLLYSHPDGANVTTLPQFRDSATSPPATIIQPGPTVTPIGTTGATTYLYAVSSLTARGESECSTPSEITNGNAALDATNYNAISWNNTPGASAYRVYKSTDGVSYMLIADNVTAFSYNDQGANGIGAGGPLRVMNSSGDGVLVRRGIKRSSSDRLVLGKLAGAPTPTPLPLDAFTDQWDAGSIWNLGPNNLWGGYGAPSNTLPSGLPFGVPGDYYLRTDAPGVPTERLYVKTSTGWAPAIAGSLVIATNTHAALINETTLCTSGTFAVALPQPLIGGPDNTVDADNTVTNTGTGTITVVPGSGVLYGLTGAAGDITLTQGQSARIRSDGTNWYRVQ